MEFTKIDGLKISAEVKAEVKEEVGRLAEIGVVPCLAVVLVGDDPASKIYVANKQKACEAVGIKSLSYILPEDTEQDELDELIESLNESGEVNGILVQLPLPKHLDEDRVIKLISPKKDVDCFHPYNVGRLWTGDPFFLPCTPAGVIELIKRSGFEIEGKDCVVIGRSNIVGKPVSALLQAENGTVTMCHSKTKNLGEICKRADIIVVATGHPNTLTADMVKNGAVIIDVGINRKPDGKLCGDADYENISKKGVAMTPVPGGVGPMTIAMLMKNCVKAVSGE